VNESAGEKLWKRRAQTALGNRRSDFHFSHSFNNNKLDDRNHFLQNAKTSVASLRRLITPTRNADHDQPGTLITFIGIRKNFTWTISALIRVERRGPRAENKAVTDTTFIRFRGRKALKGRHYPLLLLPRFPERISAALDVLDMPGEMPRPF